MDIPPRRDRMSYFIMVINGSSGQRDRASNRRNKNPLLIDSARAR